MLYVVATDPNMYTVQALKKVRIPAIKKQVSSKFIALNHGFVAETVLKAVKNAGYEIERDAWLCYGTQKQSLLGVIDVTLQLGMTNGVDNPCDHYKLSMIVDTSNDGYKAFRIGTGARLAQSKNGIYLPDTEMIRKHSIRSNFMEIIQGAVDEWYKSIAYISEYIEILKSIPISDRYASQLFLLAVKQHVFSTMYIPKIMENWYAPAIELAGNANTAWMFHNAIADVIQQTTPQAQLRILEELYKFIHVEVIKLPWKK
jgi:hypothetical protein